MACSDPPDSTAAEVVERIVAADGRAAAFLADISDEDSVTALSDAIRSTFGPVRTLVNNAGVWKFEAPVDLSVDECRRHYDIADVTAFLASDAARYIGGKTIFVAGGLQLTLGPRSRLPQSRETPSPALSSASARASFTAHHTVTFDMSSATAAARWASSRWILQRSGRNSTSQG